MSNTERVAIFIDGSNFYHGLKTFLGHARVNFEKFCNVLTEGRHLTRIYYYNAPLPQDFDSERYREQQKFFESIRKIPYLDLKLGKIEIRGAALVEKGVDVLIAIDMIKYAKNNAYDTAILVSGDGDFAPVLEFLKDYGKHIENAYFKKGRSYNLSNHSDRFIKLDNLNWEDLIL
ncbi:MAG: NYN domain-containing protein [Deltaproteobacteria bacterium]|uniref:NYN domain-containing protein n=1 Tax=Candidatus Zymogenus saltonus TaxID=2844893 RepID=A0A9D8KCN9_9DELT|nr:NYN domain-containing protein [Candidatus Zymogenus saltonus]